MSAFKLLFRLFSIQLDDDLSVNSLQMALQWVQIRQWTKLNCVSICAIANKTNILHTYIFPLTNTCTCIHILKCVRIHVESSSSSCVQILLFLLPKYAISIVEFLGRENEKTRWDKKASEWREKARARERKQTIEIRAQHKRSKKKYIHWYREHRYMKFHWKKCAL